MAAHQFRLDQARALIRSVMVQVTTENRTVSTVHYVRDPAAGDEQGYVSVDRLRSEPENALALIRLEFARAETCLRRAEDLADALGCKAEVAGVSKKLARARKRVEAAATT